ncbi:electron transport complex subunit RsxC [Chitinibacter bivalviorum]|uniref:Ion-translocating oxidoreductase complex subunit C n=1 Tax=Chitinibacter bivalviorum TaxID=2739434 RepID=A0A7H9BIR5_9NEIS|nr:electron transport complex subunit RsxC [Chitinibacter bivalviorum]QLG88547.1 electron transport complex subunit RsxC [Chitinibacter bivalviorum]
METSREIFPFHGGVHPPEMKDISNRSPIQIGPIAAQLVIPLQQSIGNPAKTIVAVGDKVLKGQKIAVADGNLSVAVHAPTSGEVIAIDARQVAHPSGLAEWCVTIATDGRDEWIPREKFDWQQALARGDAKSIRDYLQDMGVVGQGGAVFPSHLKLAGREALETLVINGAECEPYITCDDRLMRERAIEIVAGISIVRQLLNAKEVLIGIEDNKMEAVAALREALGNCGFAAEVVVVPTLYPSGGAKQLIKLLTNKEVPSGVRSTDLGVQCFNVATIYSIYAALEQAEPVISRIVTLTGAVAKAGNVDALIGTPIDELLRFAGVELDSNAGADRPECIYGGPMMGFTLPSTQVGLTKAGNCIIAMDEAHFPSKAREMPCIRCGECAVACPQELQPMDLYWFARSKNFGKAQEWNLFDCIECGACAYVCPSSIQLVDYYRFAKSEIWDAERAKKLADTARERHEFKQFREEREKAEKAERLAARAAPKPVASATEASPADQSAADEKAAKIKAAMARAAAKKAEEGGAAPPPPPNSEAKIPNFVSPEKAAKIKESMEKRAAEKAELEAMTPEQRAARDAERAAKIEAAKAAAAAKKAVADTPGVDASEVKSVEAVSTDTPSSTAPAMDEEKAAKIRAAMAAAAAKKAAKAAGVAVASTSSDAPSVTDTSVATAAEVAPQAPAAVPAMDEEKAAKIRAAMAAAAAKKAAKAEQAAKTAEPKAGES